MKFIIETLGCKVNQHDSELLADRLTANGHIRVDTDPDLIIINTCAVTGEAARKSRQTARHLKGKYPAAKLVVCGCAAAQKPEWAKEAGAETVTGILNFTDDIHAGTGIRTRATLKIEDGCDNYCAYCVIPYLRGSVKSVPLEEIALKAAALDAAGYREIVVIGIEISSYGMDLHDGTGLFHAIKTISQSAPNARLRLSSLEPGFITPEFARSLASLPNICNHFHLSLQSGCDGVLKRMKRKYDTRHFTEAVSYLRELFPNAGITADLIAGFPGETEDEHLETLSFLRACAFSAVHVFPFSAREGTLAAKMPNQVLKSVKIRRAAEARSAAALSREAFLKSQVGRTLEVLFESDTHGHSSNYLEVRASGGRRGEIYHTVIEAVDGSILCGRLLR